MPTRRRNRLSTVAATAMVRIAANHSNLVNTKATRTVGVGEVSLNSIKDSSNTTLRTLSTFNKPNSINKLTRMPSCAADEEDAEALPITAHRLSRDASYINQHRNLKTLTPKANISMASLHAKSRLLK
jgi:hypothetical protein